jgi:hypothetical protein
VPSTSAPASPDADDLAQRDRAASIDDEVADARDAAAMLADTAASARDVAAMERDFEADIEMTRGPMTTAAVRAQRDREAAARDRNQAVDDRSRARQDRKTASQQRSRAADDRNAAAESVVYLGARVDEAENSAADMSIVGQAQGKIMQEEGLNANEALVALALRNARQRQPPSPAALIRR